MTSNMKTMTSLAIKSENSIENMKIFNRIMKRKAANNEDIVLSPTISSRQILNGHIVGSVSSHPLKKSQSLTPTNSCSRFVLNGKTNFCSLRIEDPKKVEDMNDNDVKLMLSTIPEISRHLVVCGKLGEGTFSKVFRAKHLRNSSKEYALKYVVPTIRPSRISAEIRYLRDLGGTNNIIGVNTCFFSSGHTVIVMPIFTHQKFTDYVNDLTVDEVRHYMRNLLTALERVHSFGVIHRDIKPANFLFDRKTRKYALVDFGLAQNERELLIRTHTNSSFRKINPKKEKSIKDSKQFKRPETADTINKSHKRLALIDCTTTANNDNKWQIRKRSRNDAKLIERSKIAPKRARLEIPTDNESSVFHSPITPTIFKSPISRPAAEITESMTTPIKCGVSVVPETPPKTLMKNLSDICGDSNEQLIPKEVTETPKSRYKTAQKKIKTSNNKTKTDLSCDCLKANQICSVCKSKPELVAPRAGTPGFRAPEVLLRCLLQTTQIDIWSAGVIFASLLSGRYPFFRNIDDMTSLAEIITVLGSRRVQKAAKALNKTLIVSNNYSPMNLKELCQRLRDNPSFNPTDSAYDLLDKLLEPNPHYRLTATKALTHPFFNENIN